jgi:hypothetical protein
MLVHNAEVTGSLKINNVLFNSGSFSGSFRGDGSRLTGIASYTDADTLFFIQGYSGSYSGSFFGDGSNLTGVTSYTDADTLDFINSLNVVSGSIQTLSTVSDTFTSVTSYTVTHNFGTKQVIVSVYENDTLIFPSSINTPTTNTVTITFPEPVTGRVVVVKAGHVVSGSINYTSVLNKPTLVSGSSQISFTGITNKPTLISGSSQVSFTGITNKPSLISGSAQIAALGYATTGSNQFKASQVITGSLTVTGAIVAQTLNVQQVTSSVIFSSGSNVFGNSVSNTQQFTGSLQVSGSSHNILGNVGMGTTSPAARLQIIRDGTGSSNTSLDGSQLILSRTTGNSENIVFRNTGASNGISGTSYAGQIISHGNNILEIYTNVSNPIIFGTDATERMRITPSGSIEIGTTGISSPSGADRFIGIYGAQDSSLILQDNVQTWELYVNDDFYINRGSTNVLTLNRTTGTSTFTSNSGIRVGSTDGGRVFIRQSAGGDAEIGANANGGLFLYANNVLGLSFTGAAATFSSTVQSVGVLSSGNAGATTGQIIVESGANAASRRWKLLTSQNVNGDFVIQQSTTQTGSTFADILGFNATGAATFSAQINANAAETNTINPVTNANISIAGGYSGIRSAIDHSFNIDVYNSASPINALKITQAGAATFSSSASSGQNLRLQTSIAAGRNYVQWANGSGDMGYLGYGGADGRFFIVNQLNADMLFYTNDIERMRITSGGAMFNRASTAGHTAFIGAIGPGNVGDRYLHVRINTIQNMMVWIKIFGYVYATGIIEGLSGGYVDGSTGGVAQAFQNGFIVAQYQNSSYLEIVVDTANTGTSNRWGSISFMGGTDNITTIQPLEIMAYSWTATTTRVY